MRMRAPFYALCAGLFLAAPLFGQAEDRVSIRLVPEPRAAAGGTGDEVTVGDPFWVTVRTEGPAGYQLLPQSLIDAYAAHPELAVVGCEREGGTLRLQIALFRPGDVVLPGALARVVTARGDTTSVPVRADTMRVASVLAPGDTVLADIKPPWRAPGIPWWVWAVAAALAAALLWLLWRRFRRKPAEAALAPPRDVYLEARRTIAALGAEPADQAQGLEAAAGIGDALRGYLADAWSLRARERTTLELLAVLPPGVAGERATLGTVLVAADLAKFARLAPGPREVPALASRAILVLDRIEEARRAAEAESAATVARADARGARAAAS